MPILLRLLIIFNVVLYCSYAYHFLHNTVATSIKPLYWYFFTIGSSFSFVLLDPNSVLRETPRPFIAWLWVYLFYTVISFLYSSQSTVAEHYLIKQCEVVVLLFSFLVLFLSQNKCGVRTAQLALLWVALFGALMNVIDFLTPIWSNVQGRAAGLYVNPNTSGKTLVLAMVASVPVVANKVRFPYCIVVGLGVLLTFSRNAWFLWAFAMVGLAGIGYFWSKRKVFSTVLVGGLVIVFLYNLFTGGIAELFVISGFSEHLTSNTSLRLGAEEEQSAFENKSAAARADVAAMSWEKFQERPWFGFGLGYTGEWENSVGSHNSYLRMAVEGGLIGLIVLISLLIVLWGVADRSGRVLVAVYSVSSLFTHNSLEQTATLVLLALIAATGKPQRRIVSSIKSRRGPPVIPHRKIKSFPFLTK